MSPSFRIDRQNRDNAADPENQFKGKLLNPMKFFFHVRESTKKVPSHKYAFSGEYLPFWTFLCLNYEQKTVRYRTEFENYTAYKKEKEIFSPSLFPVILYFGPQEISLCKKSI